MKTQEHPNRYLQSGVRNFKLGGPFLARQSMKLWRFPVTKKVAGYFERRRAGERSSCCRCQEEMTAVDCN